MNLGTVALDGQTFEIIEKGNGIMAISGNTSYHLNYTGEAWICKEPIPGHILSALTGKLDEILWDWANGL